ncbi:MAG: GNAT family N-acetyltransferase [Kordiimonadaceae bacterium]|nr:GNAT family N-acetyltransferase [Kordiimonadaceae bacterium]MBO6568537.1 GNAT family N-acetyltransferase [Kordiimonadaceae bacterium]MBO6963734.1 GNAT family N-acetyltransferase [Kordiimonadaceae bacterium]
MADIELREFKPSDREGCLAVLDANTPEYFSPVERETFDEFLAEPPGTYLVLVDDNRVVGCGGYIPMPDTRDAHTSWGMVHPDYKGRGLGKRLFQARLDAVRKRGDADRVRVVTSPQTESFFKLYGFEVTRREKDGNAPGIDLVEMWLAL